MVTWTEDMLNLHLLKHAPKAQAVESVGEPVEREGKLHREILKWCGEQWPRVKVISARMDKRSTIQEGAHDMTVFLREGRVLCIELKSKTGKPSQAQLIWRAEMAALGTTVHEVRSMDHFLKLVYETTY